MGSHYSALLVIDASREIAIEQFLYELTDKKYELAEAEKQLAGGFPEFPNVVVCKQANVQLIYGEVQFGVEGVETQYPRNLPELSMNCSIFSWTVEDASGCQCFDLFVHGEHKRSWFMDGGEVVINIGNPLPIEASVDLRDEWGIVEVAESFGFSWDRIIETPCSMYRPIGDSEIIMQKDSKAARKAWWKFW